MPLIPSATFTATSAAFGATGLTWQESPGRLGVNQPAPVAGVHVGQDTNGVSSVGLDVYSDSPTNTPVLFSRRWRGTPAAPLNVADGDVLFSIQPAAFTGSLVGNARADFVVDGPVVAGQRPGVKFIIKTGPPNVAAVERLAVRGDGTVEIGGRVEAGSLGVGNAETASTPGAVTHKIALYDLAGNILCYLPGYDAIT